VFYQNQCLFCGS